MRGELIKRALVARRPDWRGRVWIRPRPAYVCNLAITVRGVGVMYINGGERWEEDADLAGQVADEFEIMFEVEARR
jgi:hypothetical protein